MDKRVRDGADTLLLLPYEKKMLSLDADEIMVLQRMVEGKSDEEIAEKLKPYISVSGVKAAILRIYTKFGAMKLTLDLHRRERVTSMWHEHHTERKNRDAAKPKNLKVEEPTWEEELAMHSFDDSDLLAIMEKIPKLTPKEKDLVKSLTETFDVQELGRRHGVQDISIYSRLSTLFKKLELPLGLSPREKRAIVKASALREAN